MQSYQFQAIWRLTTQGEWRTVYDEAQDARSVSFIQASEILATLCAQRLEEGSELTARFGQEMMLARVDDQGVLVGLHHAQANPLMVRTAMSRMEQTSYRGVPATTTSLRSPSTRQASPQAPPARVLAQAPAPTDAQVPFRIADSFDTFNLDELLLDDEAPALTQAHTPESLCTWQQAADFISSSIERAQEYIGKTVASNYWREALRQASLDHVEVNLRGQVTIAHGGSQRAIAQADAALEQAWQHWLSRGRRVIPALDELTQTLGQPPWKTTTERTR